MLLVRGSGKLLPKSSQYSGKMALFLMKSVIVGVNVFVHQAAGQSQSTTAAPGRSVASGTRGA